MKNLFFAFVALLFISACDENPPAIPIVDLTGDRVVLIEEFSGGNCVPCSSAALYLEEQLSILGDKLIVVTMHTFTPAQSEPAPGATFDFRTENGQSILQDLGLPQGIPSAVINRKLFEGETGLQLRRDTWAGRLAQALGDKPKTSIALDINFEEDSRELSIDATVLPVEAITGDLKLHLLITESEIIDHQSGFNGLVTDWKHSHILRDYISSIDGDLLESNAEVGEPLLKSYTFQVPEEEGLWVAEHLELVAFATLEDEDSREVLQAKAKKIME